MLTVKVKRILLVGLVALGWSVAATPLPAQTLSVAAAANLAQLEAPLSQAFARANPGFSLRFTFGASGLLVTQALNGAPFQAFLSADRDFAQKLVDGGLASGPLVTYATGRLILLSTQARDLSRGLEVLRDPGIRQVALANPATAPYGRAAQQALTRAGLWDSLAGRLVQGQNITQAVQFTLTVTGLGLLNQSALLAPELEPYREQGRFWVPVDPALYDPLEQGAVVLKGAETLPEGRAFARFLVSAEARAIFRAAGYGVP